MREQNVPEKARTRAKSGNFLGRYTLDHDDLLKPDIKQGRPRLTEGLSPDGDPVLVRTWPRNTKDDDDLVDIWRHELRQLHRLNGYPGALEVITRIKDAGSDPKGFYIALDVGQRRPLEVLLENSRATASWLRSLTLPMNRYRLWANLRRVAMGLEILHNEGLVHRNLDAWAVLTSAGEDPDFQITGFEWSLRLSSTTDKPRKERGPTLPAISFADDWASLSRLASRIFNIGLSRLMDQKVPDYQVHEALSAQEIRFLRDLLRPNELSRLDGELVVARIDEVMRELDASRSADDARYRLALRLGEDSNLSQAVREASDLQIEMDDADSQKVWIEADVGDVLNLMTVGSGENRQLYLKGRELVYRLKQFNAVEAANWQFAFCENAEPSSAWHRPSAGRIQIPSTAVEMVRHTAARVSFQRLRGRTPIWTNLFAQSDETSAPLTREGRLHRAMTLLHGIEIARAAANVFSVVVEGHDAAKATVALSMRANKDSIDLSKALGLETPATRLRRGLEEEGLGEEEGWVFTETAGLGQNQVGDVDLTFAETTSQDGEVTFHFNVTGQSPILVREGYIIPSAARGDIVQFKRRSQAIRKLKDHTELLRNLADPRGHLMASHETVEHDAEFAQLDNAKQNSLGELTSVLPTYMLQGPPGVGKTYLIKDLVRRRFQADQSTRMLVTAQGNHAIDHLLDELADLWTADPNSTPLAVRCRPKDDRAEPGLFDLNLISAQMVSGLKNTSLASAASPSVAGRLSALSGLGQTSGVEANSERRALEGLIMRSANLVFATTNSADLERLLEERGQFDWVVVEEAGKATGCELATPLMLSHRRLLIGDHKQLPPFGARETEELLLNKTAVRGALKALPKFLDHSVRSLLDEDLLDFIDDEEEEIEVLCTGAIRILYLFETALTAELDRQKLKPGGRSIASTLEYQHRMHPKICELVSHSFYNGRLKTAPEREIEAAVQAKWIASADTALLPDLPVVFVDMPYERSTPGGGRIEQEPRFTNEDEVAQIVRLIEQLKPTKAAIKKPSLVVLAPYKKQVARLKDALLGDHRARHALQQFKPVARGGEWFSTVDAFQGNEADVVVFSLVRNNRGATIRKALGFVGDRRRFNVILSRAKQRLIFVGSKMFLETISRPLGIKNDEQSDFLRIFLKTLDDQVKNGHAGLVLGRSSRES